MKIDISYKYLEKSPILEEILQKKLNKIARHVKMFGGKPTHLLVHFEKNPHHQQYLCRLNMFLPSRLIKAESYDENISGALDKSVSALIKQLEKIKYRLERHLSKRESLKRRV